jgi:hypothetical protein
MRFYLRNPIKAKFVVKHCNLLFSNSKSLRRSLPQLDGPRGLIRFELTTGIEIESNKKSFKIDFYSLSSSEAKH